MSEVSAKSTSPNARNFTYCTVKNFRRVFRHPSHFAMRRQKDMGPDAAEVWAHFGATEIAGLSCEPCDGCSFSACRFEVPAAEFPALAEREEMYDLVVAEAELPSGDVCSGFVCCAMTSDEPLRERMGEAAFQTKYGQHFNGNPLPGPPRVWEWEGPILPARLYLRHCVLAIRNQAGESAAEELRELFISRGVG